MTSADFSWQALLRDSEIHPPHVHETSPVMDILFPSYTCLIYLGHFRIAIVCSSGQMFAAGFLQIPPHDGHPCLGLYYTLPAIGRVTDLHRLENVHAGRTIKASLLTRGRGFYVYLLFTFPHTFFFPIFCKSHFGQRNHLLIFL